MDGATISLNTTTPPALGLTRYQYSINHIYYIRKRK
jgi:hypothetical protein